MNALDHMIDFPVTKDVQDITKSDFIFHNGQYILNCKPRWSTRPVGMAIDREDWDDFDEDLIRRIIQSQIDKNRGEDFGKMKGGLSENKILSEGFFNFYRSRN